MEKIPAWALLFLLGQSIIKMYAEALPPPGSRCPKNSVILLGKTGVLRMEQRVTDFFEMLRTRKVGLVGFGVTNNGIAKMLAAKGIHVTIHDRQERAELGDICREMEEETGLKVEVKRLLYLCDAAQSGHTLLHATFLAQRTGGALRLPDNTKDKNPISDVRFVPVEELTAYGFSETFQALALAGFPGGGYAGDKSAIGLGI